MPRPASVRLLALVVPALAAAACLHPGPAFPRPALSRASAHDLLPLYNALDHLLPTLNISNVTSYSLELTSASETLWSSAHTAPVLGNYTDSLATNVSRDTAFRIASISKVFTVFGVLLQNNVSLEDSIASYVPELSGESDGGADWEQITIGAIASQLSGLAREYGQSDLTFDDDLEDPVGYGLPEVDEEEVPPCGRGPADPPCTRKQFLNGFSSIPPLFAPNDRSTYSNVNFALLGLALENITGRAYADVITTSILHPLGMNRTTLIKPPDSAGVIPALENTWDWNMGMYKPTGGIYSTASDLSRLQRAILTSALLPEQKTNAWLKPRSYTAGLNSAYGMPWEILRTDKTTGDSRAIDLYTKGGSLPGYYSNVILVPEYGIGMTALVAGEAKDLVAIGEALVPTVLKGVETAVRNDVRVRYSGDYVYYSEAAESELNSTLTLVVPPNGGLKVERWVSNGTDFLATYAKLKGMDYPFPIGVELHLFPSNLYRHRNGTGEVWRADIVREKTEVEKGHFFSDQCSTDVDSYRYAGKSILEMVFYFDQGGMVEKVLLPGLRVVLGRKVQDQREEEGVERWVKGGLENEQKILSWF